LVLMIGMKLQIADDERVDEIGFEWELEKEKTMATREG